MKYIFWKRNVTEDLRKNSTFEERKVKSVYYGAETMSYIGPEMWELVPSNINDSENLSIFKSNIKSDIWLIELWLVWLIDYNLF